MARLRLDIVQKLRAIGQAIEAQNTQDFEVEVQGVDYLVRCNDPKIEVRLTPAEVERLESEGRAKRKDTQGMPDPYRPSQVLRAVGDYLKSQHGRLLRVAKSGPSVTLEFKTAQGVREVEVRTVPSLYDHAIRMYLRRRSRA